jgi:zinc protease
MKKTKIIKILVFVLILSIFLTGCQIPYKEEKTESGKKYILENGFTIITKENPNTNLAVFDLFIKTGTLTEEKNGISYLTTKTLLTRTKKHNREELIQLLEKDGGNFEIIPTAQYNEIRITIPSTAISTALKFLQEILTEPEFNQEEIEKEKKFIIDEIKTKKDNPQTKTDELLYSKIFKNTPYSKPAEGTEESINSISKKEIEEYYSQYYTANNMILIISGNINKETEKQTIKLFNKLKKKEIYPKEIHFQEYESERAEENQYTDSYYINIGYRTVPANSPDTVKLKTISGILGQGPASRLFYEIREKQGLVYMIETFHPTIKDTGLFKISAITRPENLNKTIEEILKQIEMIKKEKISEEELKETKTRIKGYYAINHQLTADVTEYIGIYETAGLGYQWDEHYPKLIDAITAEEIQETAQKYLNNPIITIIGPFKEIEIKSIE